jgi:hypothetical protein
MSIATEPKSLIAPEFLRLDHQAYELIDGVMLLHQWGPNLGPTTSPRSSPVTLKTRCLLETRLEPSGTAGVRLVWVVNPMRCDVVVCRGDGDLTRLKARDQLGGEGVLRASSCATAERLPPVTGGEPVVPTA